MNSEAELSDLLTTPSAALIADLAQLDGDIMVLGAGGKMGPALCGLAVRALAAVGRGQRVIAVSRWTNRAAAAQLEASGVTVLTADLARPEVIDALEPVANLVFMVGKKFGTDQSPSGTWWTNAHVAGLAGVHFRDSRIAAFSSGNVYPLVEVTSGGSTVNGPVGPLGEYAQACLARERMFEAVSDQYGTQISLLRLNYAVEMRYGVLVDIARQVLAGEPVDCTTGVVNVCWQGWANEVALRSLTRASSPPTVINMTGPETVSVAWLAQEFGRLLDREVTLTGTPATTALLNNALDTHADLGYPSVPLATLVTWTAKWLREGGEVAEKPTLFAVRTGAF
jgi:nucleoside-diphosphate-sugar epimerase